MKKHILGFAVFNFILASFAFIFAFFYAPPIPQIAEVKEKIEVIRPSVSHEKTSCFRKKQNKLSSEVVSSQLFLDENKIISNVKLSWNGIGNPPKKVIAMMMFSAAESRGYTSLGTHEIFLEPFDASNEQTFTVVSRILGDEKFIKQNNFYAVSSVLDYESYITNAKIGANISERKEVVTVHGNSSIIGK